MTRSWWHDRLHDAATYASRPTSLLVIAVLIALWVAGAIVERRHVDRKLRGRRRSTGLWRPSRTGLMVAHGRPVRGPAVYIMYLADGSIDYIGETVHCRRRFREHAHKHRRAHAWRMWVTIACDSKAEALALQNEMISEAARNGHSLSNIVMNPRHLRSIE